MGLALVREMPPETLSEVSGVKLTREYTSLIDRLIVNLFRQGRPPKGVAIIALGGYGRRELCPGSDIDLLFLYGEKVPEKRARRLIEKIVYPLWDKGLEASHTVRSIAETIEDAREDFFLKTALLEARLLAGEKAIFEEFKDVFISRVLAGHRREFFEDVIEHNRRRHERFGDVSFMLEPNIKEGAGGLRDFHSIFWVAKGLFGLSDLSALENEGLITGRDREDLEEALDFLLKVRFKLHLLCGRKNDRLYFEHQEALARELAFNDQEGELAVEGFMRRLHLKVACIKYQTESFFEHVAEALDIVQPGPVETLNAAIELHRHRVTFADFEQARRQPGLIMRLFEAMAEVDCPIHPLARQFVRQNLEAISRIRQSRRAARSFLKLLTSPGAYRALTAMLETGVLTRFIPEFSEIEGRTQFDFYHTYTVDRHSLLTVAELSRLAKEEPSAWEGIESPEVVYLAGLLHDIGKGKGEGHARRGAKIAQNIGRRLGLTPEELEDLYFLIENHLLLAETAMRRDLSEERVAFRFARKMGTASRLRMLYLLTVADSRATGPLAWNDWKAALVRELYLKSLRFLEQGVLSDPGRVEELNQKWQMLREKVQDFVPPVQLEATLSSLPQSYLLAFSLPEILEHLHLAEEAKTTGFACQVSRINGTFRMTLVCRDRPGLFSRITGVFTLHHLDIRSAKIFTWFNGLAVDVFELLPPWPDFDQWEKVISNLNKALKGKIAISARMAEVKPLCHQTPKVLKSRRPEIIIDNEASDFFTIIEIYAPDCLGLLYQIARSMCDLDLNIHRAFISNKADLSADVFYVTDIAGEKILDPEQQEEIKKALIHALK